jgi:hypothetical protein
VEIVASVAVGGSAVVGRGGCTDGARCVARDNMVGGKVIMASPRRPSGCSFWASSSPRLGYVWHRHARLGIAMASKLRRGSHGRGNGRGSFKFARVQERVLGFQDAPPLIQPTRRLSSNRRTAAPPSGAPRRRSSIQWPAPPSGGTLLHPVRHSALPLPLLPHSSGRAERRPLAERCPPAELSASSSAAHRPSVAHWPS